MSLETWKQEYYPIPADQTDKSSAVAHSLKKWEGLRPEILKAHGVAPNKFADIVDEAGKSLAIDASTCALCHHHWDGGKEEEPGLPPEDHACGECPLYLARGNHCCAGPDFTPGEGLTPFGVWNRNSDPEPMIHWLKRAQEYEATSHGARMLMDGGSAPADVLAQNNAKPPIGGLTCETPAKPVIVDPLTD